MPEGIAEVQSMPTATEIVPKAKKNPPKAKPSSSTFLSESDEDEDLKDICCVCCDRVLQMQRFKLCIILQGTQRLHSNH